MSDGVQRFDLPVAAVLRVQSRSGRVEVIAEPRDDVLVEGERAEVRQVRDGKLVLEVRAGRAGSKPLKVRCPVATDVSVGTQSGAVTLRGQLGSVSVTTLSGDIEVERAEEADLRTGAGSIRLESCDVRCRMNSMSGKIEAGRVGAAAAGTVSGSIRVEHVTGKFKAGTVSGSIDAACDGGGDIAVKTVSGKVQIALPRETALARRIKSLSGRVRVPFPEGDDVRLEAMTVSGSIDVVPR